MVKNWLISVCFDWNLYQKTQYYPECYLIEIWLHLLHCGVVENWLISGYNTIINVGCVALIETCKQKDERFTSGIYTEAKYDHFPYAYLTPQIYLWLILVIGASLGLDFEIFSKF